jgi:hypothetical protein
MNAFCLKAPTVRFVNLAIVLAGVFLREWLFNSRKSSLVHRRSRTFILPPPETGALGPSVLNAPFVLLAESRLRFAQRGARRAATITPGFFIRLVETPSGDRMLVWQPSLHEINRPFDISLSGFTQPFSCGGILRVSGS